MVLCGKSNSDVNNYVLCGKQVMLYVHIKTVQDEKRRNTDIWHQMIYKSNSDVSNHVLSWYQFRNIPSNVVLHRES